MFAIPRMLRGEAGQHRAISKCSDLRMAALHSHPSCTSSAVCKKLAAARMHVSACHIIIPVHCLKHLQVHGAPPNSLNSTRLGLSQRGCNVWPHGPHAGRSAQLRAPHMHVDCAAHVSKPPLSLPMPRPGPAWGARVCRAEGNPLMEMKRGLVHVGWNPMSH